MADEKDIADDAAPAGGGKKKLILIVAGAVVLMSLGAGGAVFLFMGGEDSAPNGEAEVVEEEQGDPVYHAFKPAFVVSLPPGGPAGMLQVGIDVMTRTPEVVEVLQANDPMLRHHIINLLEGQEAAALMTLEGKQALQTALHELLSDKLEEFDEPGKIKGVYFTQLVLQ